MKRICLVPTCLIFISLLIFGCSGGSGNIEEKITAVENSLMGPVISTGIVQAEKTMAEEMTKYTVPGVGISLINDNKIEWSKGYGILKSGGNDSVTANTLFPAGSVSRTIMAATVLNLARRGLVDLDGSAGDYADGLEVTVRDILNNPDNDIFILQRLIEDAVGLPLAEAIKSLVFEPLGMEHSIVASTISIQQMDQIVTGHDIDGKTIEISENPLSDLTVTQIWATASDLAVFALELSQSYRGQSDKLLTQEMAAEMLKSKNTQKGMGLVVRSAGDSLNFTITSENDGFYSIIFCYPTQGQGVIVMTNSASGRFIAGNILRAVSKVYNWPDYKSKKKYINPTNAAVFDSLSGVYKFENSDNSLEVMRHQSALYVIFHPEENRIEILPTSDSGYFSAELGWPLVFKRGSDGRFDRLILSGTYHAKKIK